MSSVWQKCISWGQSCLQKGGKHKEFKFEQIGTYAAPIGRACWHWIWAMQKRSILPWCHVPISWPRQFSIQVLKGLWKWLQDQAKAQRVRGPSSQSEAGPRRELLQCKLRSHWARPATTHRWTGSSTCRPGRRDFYDFDDAGNKIAIFGR